MWLVAGCTAHSRYASAPAAAPTPNRQVKGTACCASAACTAVHVAGGHGPRPLLSSVFLQIPMVTPGGFAQDVLNVPTATFCNHGKQLPHHWTHFASSYVSMRRVSSGRVTGPSFGASTENSAIMSRPAEAGRSSAPTTQVPVQFSPGFGCWQLCLVLFTTHG